MIALVNQHACCGRQHLLTVLISTAELTERYAPRHVGLSLTHSPPSLPVEHTTWYTAAGMVPQWNTPHGTQPPAWSLSGTHHTVHSRRHGPSVEHTTRYTAAGMVPQWNTPHGTQPPAWSLSGTHHTVHSRRHGPSVEHTTRYTAAGMVPQWNTPHGTQPPAWSLSGTHHTVHSRRHGPSVEHTTRYTAAGMVPQWNTPHGTQPPTWSLSGTHHTVHSHQHGPSVANTQRHWPRATGSAPSHTAPPHTPLLWRVSAAAERLPRAQPPTHTHQVWVADSIDHPVPETLCSCQNTLCLIRCTSWVKPAALPFMVQWCLCRSIAEQH